MLLLVPLFWGGAFAAAKHVVTEIPAVTAAALRFGLAGIILWIIAWARGFWNPKLVRDQWLGLLLMSLTGIFGYNVFFFKGLEHTSAMNGSLIVAATPVFVTLGAVLFLKEPWSGRLGAGLLLSLTGVFLVIIKGSPQILLTLSFNKGDLLFIGGLICWVAHGLIGKVVLAKCPPFLTTTVTTMAGSFFLIILSFNEDGWSAVPGMSVQSWLEMWFMILCASVIAFLLWNKGIQKAGASKSSLYMNLVPMNAALISFFLYGEPVTWQQIAGMLMVIFGVFLAASSDQGKTAVTKKEKIV
ncbi:DMT family transporter [Siminovitchia sediminis]|uniref:DMT family transporter n=1 Tax=Siminovitchia sediminis TaxID=1274353 RepID=A0ABW4KBK1_9BACI